MSDDKNSGKNIPREDLPEGSQGFYVFTLNSGTKIVTHLPAYDFIQSLPVENRRELDTLILGLANNPIIPLLELCVYLLPEPSTLWGHKLLFKMIQKEPTNDIKKMINAVNYNNEIANEFNQLTGIGTSLQIAIPKSSKITQENVADYVKENDINHSIVPFSLNKSLEKPEDVYYPPIDEVEFND